MTAGHPNSLSQHRTRQCKAATAVVAGIVLATILSATVTWRFHANPTTTESASASGIALRPGLRPDQRLTAHIDDADLPRCLLMYMELTGRKVWPNTNRLASSLDEATGGRLTRWRLIAPAPQPDSGISFHADGALTAAETKVLVEAALTRANVQVTPVGRQHFRIGKAGPPNSEQKDRGR